MPTITLSWTDMALFGLTAGLIGGIVLVGRSNLPPIGPAESHQKKNAQSKKKKKAKKAESTPGSPRLPSPADRHERLGNSSSPAQAATAPEPIPDSPPAARSPPDEADRVPAPLPAQSQTAKKKKAAKKPADTFNDQEFPPLAAAKEESNKPNQNKPKRPFAERHQQPVRKTIVDDMIDEDVQKPSKMARVMNIVDSGPEDPSTPPSDPEDGWEKVPDSKRSRTTGISISIGAAPSAPSSSKPKPESEQATSKRQRQNARKKEAAKALKAAEEAARLGHLSAHKREQERLRMNAQTRAPQQPSASSTKPVGKKVASASLAEDGRLIWE